MGMFDIFLGVIAYAAVIATVVLAYAAGRNDDRRKEQRKPNPRADAPIPMEHTHGGDADDL